MKNKSIITILSLCLGLSLATTSCDDMLSSNSERHSYTVAGDTLYSYWGILKSLQNIGERYVILGECRGDLIDGGEWTTDSVNALLSFGLNGDVENFKDGANRYLKVSDYYHVINSCNAYLAQVDTILEKPSGDRYMLREYAQVEAIRAWTYMQLVVNYGDVPFYTDPLLTTNDINNFNALDANNRVTAANLWEKLEKKLIRAYEIEEAYGYPQYESYGFKTSVCHATKAMFPNALVLADIYLMGNKYQEAAKYYYEFLDGKFGGVLPTYNYSTAFQGLNDDTPTAVNNGYPWNETNATNKSNESITAIPSSVNSLWGIVQRGVNDLYGFEATISQSTSASDSTTTANIYLTKNWERQLGPSAGYDNLCKAQKYEIYHTDVFTNIGEAKLVVLEGIGDARGIAGKYGIGYISRYESGDYYVDEIKTERYIMKQNPFGGYSTVFPMVYRKSMVWLRFAEALNRAGYPGYAFAILKNGLTKNTNWLPNEKADFAAKSQYVGLSVTGYELDENGAVKMDDKGKPVITTKVLPEDWEENPACLVPGLDFDEAAFTAKITELAAQVYPTVNQYLGAMPEDEEEYASYGVFVSEGTDGYYFNVDEENMKAVEYTNFQPKNTPVVCDYISRDEWERSQGVIWLDFNKSQFDGSANLPVHWIKNWPLESSTTPQPGLYPNNDEGMVTRGIHQKGCGTLKYNEKNSVYNFVDQINLKLKAKGYNTELSKQEIYDVANRDLVIEAVEELILDEAALELAFEGNRFFDLMRVASRRTNPAKFMADKIRARGANTSAWVNNLESNVKYWYLPLPDYSNRPQ